MPKYLLMGSYTPEGARGLLKEGGSSRRAATEKLVKSVGGTLDAYYFAFGSDDFILIVDAPGPEAVAAAALTASASGAVTSRTVVLLTPEEIDAAAKLTPTYRAPGA
ncbi:MAG TPA: GYD domain-containing protein [Candidatus Sulfotelmatobacter sp.]|nr:GYD domain-containing protein [Candidatus Sulfotelmatobacter sp.]